jgi:hypothetical protein
MSQAMHYKAQKWLDDFNDKRIKQFTSKDFIAANEPEEAATAIISNKHCHWSRRRFGNTATFWVRRIHIPPATY